MPRGPGSARSRAGACHRPGGPASRRCGCGHSRDGRRPSGRRRRLAVGRQSGAVHNVTRDLRPLVVGQRVAFRGGADRAVPDGAVEPARPERGVRLLEQAAEPCESRGGVREQRGFEFGWVRPSGDQVRVGVFFEASGAERVVDQPGDSHAARIAAVRDHRSLRRISSAAASTRSARRRQAAAYGSRSGDTGQWRSAWLPPGSDPRLIL